MLCVKMAATSVAALLEFINLVDSRRGMVPEGEKNGSAASLPLAGTLC
jgi:hypothetical protein